MTTIKTNLINYLNLNSDKYNISYSNNNLNIILYGYSNPEIDKEISNIITTEIIGFIGFIISKKKYQINTHFLCLNRHDIKNKYSKLFNNENLEYFILKYSL